LTPPGSSAGATFSSVNVITFPLRSETLVGYPFESKK
jgi:hypothetical protein